MRMGTFKLLASLAGVAMAVTACVTSALEEKITVQQAEVVLVSARIVYEGEGENKVPHMRFTVRWLLGNPQWEDSDDPPAYECSRPPEPGERGTIELVEHEYRHGLDKPYYTTRGAKIFCE